MSKVEVIRRYYDIFRFEFDGKECVSDGVSIAEFNQNGKIANMREFQSTHDHYSPYKD